MVRIPKSNLQKQRSIRLEKDVQVERAVKAYLDECKKTNPREQRSLQAISAMYGIRKQTLYYRTKGRLSLTESRKNQFRIPIAAEDKIEEYVINVANRGLGVTHWLLQEIAQKIVKQMTGKVEYIPVYVAK
jgi:hypothetical protein